MNTPTTSPLPTLAAWQARSFWATLLTIAVPLLSASGVDLPGLFGVADSNALADLIMVIVPVATAGWAWARAIQTGSAVIVSGSVVRPSQGPIPRFAPVITTGPGVTPPDPVQGDAVVVDLGAATGSPTPVAQARLVVAGQPVALDSLPVRFARAGDWTLEVEWSNQTSPNALGTASGQVAPLIAPDVPVATRPGQVSGLSATPGNGTVDLAFSAPANTGGSPITGYLIQVNINNAGWTTLGTIGAFLIYSDSGLSNDIPRAYRVFAINALGTGTTASNIASATPIAASEFHAFFLTLQSNSIGFDIFDGGVPFPPGTLQLARGGGYSGGVEGELVPAIPALDHSRLAGNASNYMSTYMQFCIDYQAANPGVTIVLIPSAYAGAGFGNNFWNPGDAWLEGECDRLNTLMASRPDIQLKGVFGVGGEADAAEQFLQSARWDAMRARMIAKCPSITATTPFVNGGLYSLSGNNTMNAMYANFPQTVPYSAYASSLGYTHKGDNLHFNAASLRLHGAEFAVQLVNAQANDAVPVDDLFAFGTPDIRGSNTVSPIAGGWDLNFVQGSPTTWNFSPSPFKGYINYYLDFTAEVDDLTIVPDVRVASNDLLSGGLTLNEPLAGMALNTPRQFTFQFASTVAHEATSFLGFTVLGPVSSPFTLKITNVRLRRY